MVSCIIRCRLHRDDLQSRARLDLSCCHKGAIGGLPPAKPWLCSKLHFPESTFFELHFLPSTPHTITHSQIRIGDATNCKHSHFIYTFTYHYHNHRQDDQKKDWVSTRPRHLSFTSAMFTNNVTALPSTTSSPGRGATTASVTSTI